VRGQWIQFRSDVGGLVNGEAQGFFLSLRYCFSCDNFRPILEAYGEVGNSFSALCCSVEVKKGRPTDKG